MGTSSFFTAIDTVAPMLIGVVRPGFIFVICCRIFAVANGACACLPAANAGTGFRLGVVGVVFAGAGVGAVTVGYPFPVVVVREFFAILIPADAALERTRAVGFLIGTGFRLGSISESAFALAGLGVGAVAVGSPVAIVVIPQITKFPITAATCCPFCACGSSPVLRPVVFPV